jgi:hypothetical protein
VGLLGVHTDTIGGDTAKGGDVVGVGASRESKEETDVLLDNLILQFNEKFNQVVALMLVSEQ